MKKEEPSSILEQGRTEVQADALNIIRDKYNRKIFNRPQRYRLPVNSRADKSVTCTLMNVPKGTKCLNFFHAFRRWLKANNVNVMQYCYEADLPEFICKDFPEEK